jgi:hypothetical protein
MMMMWLIDVYNRHARRNGLGGGVSIEGLWVSRRCHSKRSEIINSLGLP